MDDNEMERLAIAAHDANIPGHDWDAQPELYQNLMRRIAMGVINEYHEMNLEKSSISNPMQEDE